MSAAFEAPAQSERDLRSANKEYKRTKDSNVKWSYGTAPLAGVRLDPATMQAVSGSESQRTKVRPRDKPSNLFGSNPLKRGKDNITKTNRSNWEVSNHRFRAKVNAREEIKDTSRFDLTDSPAPVISLGSFMDNVRETEKFVTKEYEILDVNGEALKGKKARRNLRNVGGSPVETPSAPTEIDDDGFELV